MLFFSDLRSGDEQGHKRSEHLLLVLLEDEVSDQSTSVPSDEEENSDLPSMKLTVTFRSASDLRLLPLAAQ